MASPRSIALAAEAAAQKLRKEEQGAAAQVAAASEAARVRNMFAEDRKRLEKRYGVVSAPSIKSTD